MTEATAASAFTAEVTARITDRELCPLCLHDRLEQGRCLQCGADLRGAVGAELWRASNTVVAALTERQRVLDTVPRVPLRGGHDPIQLARPLVAPRSFLPPAAPVIRPQAAPPAPPRQTSSASLQSLLAVAGAGVFAVAAVVFTYLNPELTGRGVRTLVLSIVAALFLGGAWFLAKRKLQFSAEAIGALGMVFLALDVSMIAGYAPTRPTVWVTAGIGTLVAGIAMAALALKARIRSWLWLSLLGLAAAPMMFGIAAAQATLYGSLPRTLGMFGSAVAACALIALAPRVAGRFDGVLRSERVALTTTQAVAVLTALAMAVTIEFRPLSSLPFALTLAGVGVLALCSVRHPASGMWSAVAGLSLAASIIFMPTGIDVPEWNHALTATAAAAALIGIAALLPLPRGTARNAFVIAAAAIPTIIAASMLLAGVRVWLAMILAPHVWPMWITRSPVGGAPRETVVALAILAAAAAAFAFVGRGRTGRASSFSRALAFVLGSASALTLICLPEIPAVWAVIIALVLAGRTAAALAFVPQTRALRTASRVIVSIAVHLAVCFGAILSWSEPRLGATAGVAVLAAIALAACTVPARFRFLHVGVGYAYALVVFAVNLDLAGVDGLVVRCLTSALGSVGAIVATFLRRVPERAWHAVLVVTAVPFLIGVTEVFFQRSGWTALSTGLMFALALTLLLTRERRIRPVLRAIAAALLVPALAVITVCLAAQLPASGSPVALPLIAVFVALTLASGRLIETALERHHGQGAHAHAPRLAIEGSALLTGALAVLLGLWRDAAGPGTTCIVLMLLAIGAACARIWAQRQYGWWLAFACATGALWCVWALAGITVLEPYLLPPTLGAALLACILAARGRRMAALFGAGLATAIIPLLVMLAFSGTPDSPLLPWRGYGLVAGAWLLAGLSWLFVRRATPAVVALAAPAAAAAILAAAAASIQAFRFGQGFDLYPLGAPPLVVATLALGLAGAVPAAVAALTLRRTDPLGGRLASSRWVLAPALVILASAAWAGIHRDWLTIWTMWAFLLVLLATMVLTGLRLRRTSSTVLPPVWFVFGIAFITAVVAWSPRDLRVEWFSLPLGLMLLATGALFLPAVQNPDAAPTPARLRDWPAGWRGSWGVLGPGLVVTVLASIIATFTDPLTWRAILVIVCALLMILWGARAKLRAPFVLGIIVLPIENIFAFLVQIGRGIESMPWWITLAVVGAVLLIIAVSYERRAGGDNSITARLRDLD